MKLFSLAAFLFNFVYLSSSQAMMDEVSENRSSIVKPAFQVVNEYDKDITLLFYTVQWWAPSLVLGVSYETETEEMKVEIKPGEVRNFALADLPDTIGSVVAVTKPRTVITLTKNVPEPIIVGATEDLLTVAKCKTHPLTYYQNFESPVVGKRMRIEKTERLVNVGTSMENLESDAFNLLFEDL